MSDSTTPPQPNWFDRLFGLTPSRQQLPQTLDEVLASRYGTGPRVVNNLLRGVATVPQAPFTIAGVLGSETGASVSEAIGDAANRALRTSDARLDTDPGAFVLQNVGGAMVGLPMAAPTTRLGAALQYVNPLSTSMKPAVVGANAVAATALGGGLQETVDFLTADAPARVHDVVEFGGATVTDAGTVPPRTDAAVSDTIEFAQLGTSVDTPLPDSVDFTDTAPAEPGQTRGERIAGMLGLAAVGAGAGVSIAGARAAMRQSLNSQATLPTVVSPGTPRPDDVAQPTLPQRFVNAVADDAAIFDAQLKRAVGAGQITQEHADLVRADVGIRMTKAARETMVDNFLQTGVLPDGKYVGISPRAMLQDAAKMEPKKLAAWLETVKLLDEADNRGRAIIEGKVTGLAVDPATNAAPLVQKYVQNAGTLDYGLTTQMVPEPIRVSYTDLSYNDLHKRINDHLGANPDFVDMLNTRRKAYDTFLDYFQDAARYGTEDVRRIRSVHANFDPMFRAGDDASFLARRDISEGAGLSRAQDPYDGFVQYARRGIHEAEHNAAKFAGARFLMEDATRNPAMKQIVGNLTKLSDTDPDIRNGVTFYDKGQRMRLEIHVPQIAQMFRNDPKYAMPLLDGMRRWFQSATTGPGAAVMGALFTARSLAYNTWMATTTRAKGTSFGMVDKAWQSLGLPGGMRADPTVVVQMADAALRDFLAVTTRELSYGLRNVPGMRGLSDQMAARYRDTLYADMQRVGASNSGGGTQDDTRTGQPNLIANVSPQYDKLRPFSPGDARNIDEKINDVADKIAQLAPGPARRGWGLFKEALDIIANSPQSAYYRQNIGTFQARYKSPVDASVALARRTRQLGADPGRHGGSAMVQGAVSPLPYANIMIQGLATYGRALHENPVGTVAAIGMSTGMLATLSALSAVAYDDDAVSRGEGPTAVQDKLLSNSDQRAGEVRFYIPGYGTAHLPIEPALGPVMAAMQYAANKLLSLDNPRFFDKEWQQNRETLLRAIGDSNDRTFMESLSRGYLQFSPPPIVDAAARVQGFDIREALNLGDARIMDMSKRSSLGYDTGEVPNDPMPSSLSAVLQSLGGAGGTLATQYIRDSAIIVRDAGGDVAGKALNNVMERWALSQEDRNNFVPSLWTGPQKRTSYDTLAQTVQGMNERLQALQNDSANLRLPGTAGSGDFARNVVEGQGRPTVPDSSVVVLQHFLELQRDNALDMAQRKERQDTLKSMRGSAYSTVPFLDGGEQRYSLVEPRKLRAGENRIAEEIRDINARMATRLYDTERRLTEQTGYRVSLSTFNPLKGIEQFPRARSE